MKEYISPEIEIIKFGAEQILVGEGDSDAESNVLDEEGWGD